MNVLAERCSGFHRWCLDESKACRPGRRIKRSKEGERKKEKKKKQKRPPKVDKPEENPPKISLPPSVSLSSVSLKTTISLHPFKAK